MVWSDTDFCARVAKRCEDVGRSQRSVLKEAACAHDYLQTTPTHGRRIDRIVRIAEVLNLPLGSLLGLPMNGQIDVDILMIAYEAAQDAMQQVQRPDNANFVHTMAQIYNVLLSRQADGLDPRDPVFLKQMVDILRVGVRTRRPT